MISSSVSFFKNYYWRKNIMRSFSVVCMMILCIWSIFILAANQVIVLTFYQFFGALDAIVIAAAILATIADKFDKKALIKDSSSQKNFF